MDGRQVAGLGEDGFAFLPLPQEKTDGDSILLIQTDPASRYIGKGVLAGKSDRLLPLEPRRGSRTGAVLLRSLTALNAPFSAPEQRRAV
jgi:hypothetical protein